MTITRTNTPEINRLNRAFPVAGRRPQTEQSSFKELLNEAAQMENTGSLQDMSSLSKEQLVNITNDVQMKMNARLLDAVSSTPEGEAAVPHRGSVDRLILSDMLMSNIHHKNQNNDVSNANDNLKTVINEAARTYGVDAALVQSVIKVESNFNSNSTSQKGAMGLMQLMPGTARDLGVHNAYDPVENIHAGTRYLKMLLNRYDGNVPSALAAYNWGMGNLEKKSGQMPIETRNYIDRVTSQYEKLKA